MNLETLETRLHILIRRPSQNNHNQQYSQVVNSSSSVGTMIPTPVMPQSSNPSMMATSSMDSSVIVTNGGNGIAASALNNGNALSYGSLSNMHQQSSTNFSINPITNMLQPSTDLQRMSSHMILTPGFNNNNNQSSMNLEPPNGSNGFSNAEATIMSQSVQQKHHVGGQNSRILQNPGSHFGAGMRSVVPQNSYGFPNGGLGGGFGAVGNNMQLVNAPGTSEAYSNATPYGQDNILQSQYHQQFQQQPNQFQHQQFIPHQQQRRQNQQSHILLRNDSFDQSHLLSNVGSQQKWLLFMWHARGCKTPEEECPEAYCIMAKKLCRHMDMCNNSQCVFSLCIATNKLINHNNQCRDPECPVCIPVRRILEMHQKAGEHSDVNSEVQRSVGGICKPSSGGNAFFKPAPLFVDASEDRQPSSKRIMLETKHGIDHPTCNTCMPVKPEGSGVKGPFRGESHSKHGLDNPTINTCMHQKSGEHSDVNSEVQRSIDNLLQNA
ncbi:histone acetyltransferase HAC1-like [Impatiens glandulifera]|uniref:histone acetyltransferase HAC1-like n=1 Tax=Impatiens glandulifera TaxID=253017 RepID=UPI001FB0AF95|nr:histone acetyltransferase HAC1-like [Impatiens glandulifera]